MYTRAHFRQGASQKRRRLMFGHPPRIRRNPAVFQQQKPTRVSLEKWRLESMYTSRATQKTSTEKLSTCGRAHRGTKERKATAGEGGCTHSSRQLERHRTARCRSRFMTPRMRRARIQLCALPQRKKAMRRHAFLKDRKIYEASAQRKTELAKTLRLWYSLYRKS